jgi:hypothetical protein
MGLWDIALAAHHRTTCKQGGTTARSNLNNKESTFIFKHGQVAIMMLIQVWSLYQFEEPMPKVIERGRL